MRALTSGMIGSSFPASTRVLLPQHRQERQAGPAQHRRPAEARSRDVTRGVTGRGGSAGELRLGAQLAAVQSRSDRDCEVGIAVAARGHHLGKHAWMRRHHEVTGRGAHQHESAASARVLEGELLREPTAPRDPEHVDRLVPELAQQTARAAWTAARSCTAARGRDDPPTPGTSNDTTSMSGRKADTNGSSRSRLAPMPLHSTSGGPGPVPGRTATRRSWPSTRTRRTRLANGVFVTRTRRHR